MSVLIDTSVWVAHFRSHDESLVSLLLRDEALIHPMVLGELACGTPPAPRRQTLEDVSLLRHARHATWEEILSFIEQEKLYGQGCGIVDLALLTSTVITPGALLWTLDKRLATMAARFDVAFNARN